jgi:hypothetical protein
MKNLTPEQRLAARSAYRGHHCRLYYMNQRDDGAHLIAVALEHDFSLRVGKLLLDPSNVVQPVRVIYFDADVSPAFRDANHFEACVAATLSAYAHADRPIVDAFTLESDETAETTCRS